MNFRFIAADTLQKIIMLVVLGLWANFTANGSLEWMITIFSLSTLPNTLVMGIPLLIAMYGEYSGSLMVQVVVLQCIIWYTLLLFLFEYRGAKILIMEQFPETAGSIVSFKVESDVVSLDGHDFLETDAAIGDDGKLHVTVRKSNVSRRSVGLSGMTPRPSNLTGAEIYSLSSSRNQTPRVVQRSDSKTVEFRGEHGSGAIEYEFAEVWIYPAAPTVPVPASYPAPNPEIASAGTKAGKSQQLPQPQQKTNNDGKDIHMFVWSSSASPVSDAGGLHVFSGNDLATTEQTGRPESQSTKEIKLLVSDQNGETKGSSDRRQWCRKTDAADECDDPIDLDNGMEEANQEPNTYSSLIGLICFVSFSSFICNGGEVSHGPAVMAAASIAVGLRGTLLHVAIVQVRSAPPSPNVGLFKNYVDFQEVRKASKKTQLKEGR
ncbi:hypothetical protein E3N88_37589 [Mikania micrantha]|uniref:Auxin efflux carrier component n=1 Tax=Mikania micrantha TaxID=192012 RepID=A0A5N6LTV2_9ASTR|nr:hypothetical protein E3N88_37589 [Mikania micrantha]